MDASVDGKLSGERRENNATAHEELARHSVKRSRRNGGKINEANGVKWNETSLKLGSTKQIHAVKCMKRSARPERREPKRAKRNTLRIEQREPKTKGEKAAIASIYCSASLPARRRPVHLGVVVVVRIIKRCPSARKSARLTGG